MIDRNVCILTRKNVLDQNYIWCICLPFLRLQDSSLVNFSDGDGLSPVHLATIKGLTSVVELLLSRGAEVNGQANDGQTPLHLAVKLCQCRERSVEVTPKIQQVFTIYHCFFLHLMKFTLEKLPLKRYIFNLPTDLKIMLPMANLKIVPLIRVIRVIIHVKKRHNMFLYYLFIDLHKYIISHIVK